MSEVPSMLRLPDKECPNVWIRGPPIQRPKQSDDHPLEGLLFDRKQKHFSNTIGNTHHIEECLGIHRKSQLSFSVYVDDIKVAGKTQHVGPKWKIMRENVGNTHTAQTRLLSLHTLSPVASTAMFVSQDFSICFQPTVVEVSAVCLRRTDILDTM